MKQHARKSLEVVLKIHEVFLLLFPNSGQEVLPACPGGTPLLCCHPTAKQHDPTRDKQVDSSRGQDAIFVNQRIWNMHVKGKEFRLTTANNGTTFFVTQMVTPGRRPLVWWSWPSWPSQFKGKLLVVLVRLLFVVCCRVQFEFVVVSLVCQFFTCSYLCTIFDGAKVSFHIVDLTSFVLFIHLEYCLQLFYHY